MVLFRKSPLLKLLERALNKEKIYRKTLKLMLLISVNGNIEYRNGCKAGSFVSNGTTSGRLVPKPG